LIKERYIQPFRVFPTLLKPQRLEQPQFGISNLTREFQKEWASASAPTDDHFNLHVRSLLASGQFGMTSCL